MVNIRVWAPKAMHAMRPDLVFFNSQFIIQNSYFISVMQIRPFQPSDLDTLYRIDQECFPPGISYSRNELTGFIGRRGAKTWVALANERIVGFVIVDREPQGVGHIVTIDVVGGMRGKGVGKALMKLVEEWAQQEALRMIYLETAENNHSAQTFYSALGYGKVKEIPEYYSNGLAAWVMVKRFQRR